MKNVIFYVFMFLFLQFGYSQTEPIQSKRENVGYFGKFFKRLTLRESFLSSNAKAEPALITWTKPKDGEASWITKAAIGYSIGENWDEVVLVYPYVEFHKNTLIEKEQENFQTGVSTEWQTRNLVDNKWSPILLGAVKYNRDVIKDVTSFQGNIYFTPIFGGIASNQTGMFWVPNELTEFGNAFLFTYSPYIGLENENRFNVESEMDKGNIYRAFFRINASVWFPLTGTESYFNEKFELTFDWQFRYNLNENVVSLTAEDHSYLNAGINFLIFKSDLGSAMVGYNYINGENPAKNFEQQSFQAVTLKVKI